MQVHLRGPMDYAKSLKLRFDVADLDLPERRGINSGDVEEIDTQVCRCGKAIGRRAHTVGKCEMYKGEQDECTRRRGMCYKRGCKQKTNVACRCLVS